MRAQRKAALTIVLCGLALYSAQAQSPQSNDTASGRHRGSKRATERPLNKKERREVIATALDSRIPRRAERDCSHLVHSIYERAGFPYPYAPSDDLYDGVQGFQRVAHPQAADLVVWHGHAGIVIKPSRHQFFSFLSHGPGISDYDSRYWRGRGEPRFYRYIKNDLCAGCRLAHNRSSEF